MIKKHVFAALTVLSLLSLSLVACSPAMPPRATVAPDQRAAEALASSTAQAEVAPAATSAQSVPAGVPQAGTEQHPARLSSLRIDNSASLITIIVRRGGVLARLGHDHLIAVQDLQGSVDLQANRADLQFRLDAMLVDPPALRSAAGLDRQPSAEAVEGTRRNMLTRVLDAQRYPLVQLHAERATDGQTLQLSITLHGVTRTQTVPVTLRSDAQGLHAEGSLVLRQSDYGITPFSVMGGALAVLDPLELQYRLLAR